MLPRSRREFLIDGGKLVLLLPAGWTFLTAASGCGEKDECDGAGTAKQDGGQFTFTSSCASGHTHTFALQSSDLSTPPQAGVSGPTSAYEDGHTHTVALSQAELTTVQGGGTVAKQSSTDNGHSHQFTFKKP